MSMSALLSLSGMLSYRPDVLDNLQLPQAPTYTEMGVLPEQVRTAWSINLNDFKDFLCFQTMSMCLAVPDADWLKIAVGTWSKAHITEWQRMFETVFYKYNPLWNKDATMTEEVEGENSKTDSESATGAAVSNATATTYTHGYNDGTTHADDNLSWTHADKSKSNNRSDTEHTRGLTSEGTNSSSKTVTERGNIGVTMVQDMVEKERELAKYSIEEYIADEFKKHFCLMLW